MSQSRTQALEDFAGWTRQNITGDEKGEAQIFLDHLFRAFGQKGSLDVGGTPELRIRKAREDGGGVAFADYVWKPVVLIEMKKRGADLAKHYRQAFDYWVRLVPGRPRYVVLCNFDEFWVYDFNTQLDSPKDKVKLGELPERWGPLAFLFPTQERPVFENDREAVTRDAAAKLAAVYTRLASRRIGEDLRRRFVLQMLVALFSEDIGLLPKYTVTQLLDECKSEADTYDLLGGLFVAMNTVGGIHGGRYKGVEYSNGGLFEVPAQLELAADEVTLLKIAAKADWSKVSPEIFGTIFEGSLGKEERHAYGAHFTSPIDIMKIVRPTIVEPWREQIDRAKSLKRLQELLVRMRQYRVLDPACGSGNFLYLAYRELKHLESLIFERMRGYVSTDPQQGVFSFVNARQFYGIDINEFAVELAKVTMMIARKLAIDELHVHEHALPLDNLDDNFIAADALIDDLGNVRPWPEADVIIGNPPFLGAKRLKPERGTDYAKRLRKAYPEVPGMADYCVHWIRRTHDHLPECTREDPLAGRAGLVGTQNIRNNKSRVGGLDHVVKTGTIVDAVDNQPWSGEANVHVSLVNWARTQEPRLLPRQQRLWSTAAATSTGTRRTRGTGSAAKSYELQFNLFPVINSSLSGGADVSGKRPLRCNKRPKRCFQGKIPGYEGFMLSASQLEVLGGASEAVVPYLTGRELLDEFKIERWAIDFCNRSMLEASAFSKPFAYCKKSVLPAVRNTYETAVAQKSDMAGARREHLDRWWQFWNRRDELTNVLKELPRYVACSRVTRRPVMVFLSSDICPSDLIQVFSFADDYSFAVLQGSPHFEWFRRSSRLKVETDTRYSVREVFETFPWPQSPTKQRINAVAEAGREIRRIRTEALQSIKGGLRALYRTLELPGKSPLKDAHAALDAAVLDAYGFSSKKDPLAQLLELNLDVADREKEGQPVTAPGIPAAYGDPTPLITDDCIQP